MILDVPVRRVQIVSSRPFSDVVRRLAATIGRPDPVEFHRALAEARTLKDVEAAVGRAIGPSGLMEFVRFDAGLVLRADQAGRGPGSVRFLIGNPLIMREMARAVPDAAGYAPVTILVDERADGVHLSYDTMASQLAPYGSHAALRVARELDQTIIELLEAAAAASAASASPRLPDPPGEEYRARGVFQEQEDEGAIDAEGRG